MSGYRSPFRIEVFSKIAVGNRRKIIAPKLYSLSRTVPPSSSDG